MLSCQAASRSRRRIASLLALCAFASAASAATWSPRAPLGAPRCAGLSGIAHASGAIFLTGGAHNDAYDIAGDSWSAKTPNPRPDGRTNLNSNAVIGSAIYFLGGTSITGGFDVSTLDRYDAVTDGWTLNAGSTVIPNAGAGTLVHGGNIYSFGGTLGGAATLALRLSPPFSGIFVLASVPGPGRVRPAVAGHGGKLWVIGGTNGVPITSVEAFDPLFGTWTSGPALPVASAARAAGVAGGNLHVLLDAGVYRLSGASWIQVAPPPPLLGDYAAIFVGDDLYAVGGCGVGLYSLSIAGDTTPPVVSSVSASPSVLSVPNHKLVPVTISVVASDDSDPAPAAHITSVASSEPDNGLGDGDTPGDIVVTGPLTLQLRAERAGKGPGRTYTITVTVTDASGNSSSAPVTVVVPRDQRK